MTNVINILIIDDNLDDKEYYLHSLKKISDVQYQCSYAENGQKGIAVVKAAPIDCILLDYSLPGMNGLDVLKKIREQDACIPVILLTGQGNEVLAAQSIKQGAFDYITKSSVTPELLHHTISSAIYQSLMKKDIVQKEQQIQQKTIELEHSVQALELAKIEQDCLIAKLMESNSELERFAYICSHDLQEPLRMISNFSERLEKHLIPVMDDKAKHYMKYVTDGAIRARQLISDVLIYAQLDHQNEKLSNISADNAIIWVLRDLAPRIEETKAKITHDPLPDVCMQSTHLRQLLQNLIGNALKFCSTDPEIHVGVTKDRDMWRFYVRDNGIGIPEEYKQKIFSIFQRLHSREIYPGTGIGLALCKKLVQKYGGSIWVESEIGKGSTFYFTLPSVKDQHTEAA